MVMSFNKLLRRASIVAVATSRLSSPSSITAVSAFAPSPITTSINTSQYRSLARASRPLYSTPPTRYLLTYEYIPDVLEKRGPFREGHIGLAKEMIEEGSCVSGGPTLPPGEGVPNGALFVFNSKGAAEKFVEGDPYVSGGIVTGHNIVEWSVVVGTN